MNFVILSLDGGGIRGILPLVILKHIEEKIQYKLGTNYRLANFVDYVAGTSTGSIIASAMLLPKYQSSIKQLTSKTIFNKKPTYVETLYDINDILELYFDLGDDIFSTNFWHDIKTIWGIIGPKYISSNATKQYKSIYKDYTVSQLIKPCLFTGYDTEQRRVDIFTNYDHTYKYNKYKLCDVIRGTTAVPTFFTPSHLTYDVNNNTIVDGGIFANNPSMCAYVEALKFIMDKNVELEHEDLYFLSFGTGVVKEKQYPYDKIKKWGKVQWIMPLIDLLLDAGAESTAYQIEKIFQSHNIPQNYCRINPPIITASASFYDISEDNLNKLEYDAMDFINKNENLLDNIVDNLIQIKEK